jgi:hypothetical protein
VEDLVPVAPISLSEMCVLMFRMMQSNARRV